MKIFDSDQKRVISKVTLFLTPDEAAELGQAATDLAADPSKHHAHVLDSTYSTEVVVAVHTDQNIHLFDEESRAVIQGGGNEA